jgi:hypothetical protein
MYCALSGKPGDKRPRQDMIMLLILKWFLKKYEYGGKMYTGKIWFKMKTTVPPRFNNFSHQC